ncbi:MFS transporter [Candidatus Bipolaricaulota bacterium]|nr:MFS transporter [Candidatus Bipolaricaulota bacterium]
MESGNRKWMVPFFTIWTGQQLSIIGSRAAQFALVWWLTLETGSATVLATASLVALAPQILLGPFVGALVDRWNRRVVMIVADSFIALVGLWLAFLFWSGTMQVWHIYIVMLARSFGETFHWPAMAASTTLMVPEKHYTRISGLNQTIHGLLNLIGAPLGALLLALMPMHGVMMVDVATAAFAVIPLLFVMVPQPKQEHVAAIKASSFLSNAREGLRFVLHWPGMLVLLAGASILKIALMPAFTLLPLLVKDHFGGGAPELSLFEALAGAGMLVGGLILSSWGGFKRKVYTILLGLLGIGAACLVLGFTPENMFWLALVSIFVVGLMISMADAPIAAIMQTTVPPEMQGRVFGLLGSLFSLTTPIGLVIAGPVGDAMGIPFWFRLAGLICMAVAVVSFFIPAFRQLEAHKFNGDSASSGSERPLVESVEGATASD